MCTTHTHVMNFILLAIGILCILMSFSIANETDDKSTTNPPRGRNRCPFIKTSLRNGRVKIRSRGRVAKFICDIGYELVGSRFATCVRGLWNKPIPICVTGGCPLIENPLNGQTNVSFRGALLAFTCDPGYVLNGSSNIYCDGYNWNDTAPTCDIAIPNPKLTCDFEDSTLCGWTNDRNHDFDWRRHQFSTPSGHVGTGPSYDHTLGKGKEGYYMYIEASSPRKQNDTARLFSPVYSSDLTPACFVFWYHMYGATTGTLRVFMKKETQMFQELTPVWEKEGEQGNLWLQSSLSIPKLNEKFQIIIEGIRGDSYVGDTAIDDVGLYSTPCEELAFANITKEFYSCQGRCNVGMEENSTCSCKEECLINSTCCDDYEQFCTKTANRTFIFGPEPQPKPSTSSNQTIFRTFTTGMASEESKNITKSTSIASTVNGTIQPYISTSNDSTAKLTTLLNSTFITISTTATVPTTTAQETNKTIGLTTNNLGETSTSVKLSNRTTTNTINLVPSLTTVSSYSTMKNVVSVDINNKTKLIITETTEQTTNTRNITTYLPVLTQKETTRQSTTTQKPISPPRKVTPVFTVWNPTTVPSRSKSTIVPNTTSRKPTTISNTTTKKPTTVPNTTTRKPTTVPNTTTRTTTTVPNTTTRTTTTVPTTTTRKPTTVPNTTTRMTTTIPTTTTRKPIFVTTTRKPITVPNTTTRKLTTVPNTTTSKPTTVPNTTTSKPTTVPNTTTRKPTTVPNTTSKKPIIIRDTTTKRPTTKQQITTKVTRAPPLLTTKKPSVTTRESTAKWLITTEKLIFTSRKVPLTTPTTINTKNTKMPPRKTTRNKETTMNLEKLMTSLSVKATERPNERATTRSETTATTPTTTIKFVTDSKETTELIWTIDYSSRTKNRMISSRLSKAKTSDSLTVIVAVTACVTITTLFLIAIICYLMRKRKSSQNKLADDSEMKFLSDNEIFEFSDPSLSINS